jgi:hypothetical protein
MPMNTRSSALVSIGSQPRWLAVLRSRPIIAVSP